MGAFAYLLAAMEWSNEVADALDGWYCGDVLDKTMKAEDAATDPTDVAAFDVGGVRVARVAPVQLTLAWDPRPCLLALLAQADIHPALELDRGGILYFRRVPPATLLLRVPATDAQRPPDVHRFVAILDATADLIRARDCGLLFIGGAGWSYNDRLKSSDGKVEAMTRAGMQFFDRHA
jgi:hypothetical protein